MPNLNKRFNFGNKLAEDNPELYNQMNDSYEDIANAVNERVSGIAQNVDPSAFAQINKNYNIKDVWVNKSTDKVWMMTSRTTDVNVTWTPLN